MAIMQCKQCHKPIPKSGGTRSICSTCRVFNSQVQRGIILPPDYPDTTTKPYKEPLLAVDGDGFGYIGALVHTKTGSHVQCHICGYFYGNLGAHVSRKHNVSHRDYKSTYGLRITSSLLSPLARQKAQAAYNKNARDNALHLATITRKAHKVTKKLRQSGQLKTGGNMWTEQTRNERGKCRLQTIAKIQELYRIHDGVITAKLFEDTYGMAATHKQGVIYTLFGNWEKALQAAGLHTHKQKQAAIKQQKTQEALIAIKKFYQFHGRTPQYSDFKSDDSLPHPRTINHCFSSFNEARAMANVPLLVKIAGKWTELAISEAPNFYKKHSQTRYVETAR